MVAGLARNRRGTAALEFAVAGAAFFTVLFLLVEAAWQVAIAAALDNGARQASRWAALGQPAPDGRARDLYLRDLIVRASGMPIDAAALEVSRRSFPDFSLSGPGKDDLGGAGDVLRYTVVYRSPGLTPIGRALMASGLLQIQFVILAKNEPFS